MFGRFLSLDIKLKAILCLVLTFFMFLWFKNYLKTIQLIIEYIQRFQSLKTLHYSFSCLEKLADISPRAENKIIHGTF